MMGFRSENGAPRCYIFQGNWCSFSAFYRNNGALLSLETAAANNVACQKTRVKEKWMAQTQGGRGFASMDEDKQRAIAAKGGHESGGNFRNDPQRAAEAGHKGGQVSGGNFKFNRERAAQAGRKGGLR
jgi:general stress protein YciG